MKLEEVRRISLAVLDEKGYSQLTSFVRGKVLLSPSSKDPKKIRRLSDEASAPNRSGRRWGKEFIDSQISSDARSLCSKSSEEEEDDSSGRSCGDIGLVDFGLDLSLLHDFLRSRRFPHLPDGGRLRLLDGPVM